MYESYINFLLSDELFDWVPWAQAVKNDNLDNFLKHFDVEEDPMIFDPIELAIAYDSERIFSYLIETYDYSEFFNQIDLSILILLLMFEREHFLLLSLESYTFSHQQMLSMYEYMMSHKSVDYFKQFYALYPLHPSMHKEMLKLALINTDVFDYLIDEAKMHPLLKDESLQYDIVSDYPEFLNRLDFIEDVSHFIDTDLLNNVVKQAHFKDFITTMRFLLNRGFDLNQENTYGLTPFHIALRHAKDPNYIKWMVEQGANPEHKTSMGYPACHQLLFQDAKFTFELNETIAFNEQDAQGLTLQDYDRIIRKTTLNYVDIMSVVRLLLNMDESYFYELSEEEFYHMAFHQGIEVFMPYVTLLSFESPQDKESYLRINAHHPAQVYDIMALKDMFPGKINHDYQKTLQLEKDFVDIEDDLLEHFKQFAIDHETTLLIESEDDTLNKRGKITYVFDAQGRMQKQAIVKSHLLDVYYLHFYYDIPLANITYEPSLKNAQRFLN